MTSHDRLHIVTRCTCFCNRLDYTMLRLEWVAEMKHMVPKLYSTDSNTIAGYLIRQEYQDISIGINLKSF